MQPQECKSIVMANLYLNIIKCAKATATYPRLTQKLKHAKLHATVAYIIGQDVNGLELWKLFCF